RLRPAAEAAFFVGARHLDDFAAPPLLHHVVAAPGARVGRRPLPAGEAAVGIAAAAVKEPALAGTPLNHLPLPADGTRHARVLEQRLPVLALGIARARQEL